MSKVGRTAIELVSDDQCEERPSDVGNAADEFERDYLAFWRSRGVRPAQVGRTAIELVSDDQCEERPSDVGNAADEFERDYLAWKRQGASVAGRPKYNDPSQTQKELARIAKKNPRAYSNPNIAPEALSEGAFSYPWFVEQNPVLPLLELEDPAEHKSLRESLTRGWIYCGTHTLSLHNSIRWAIECLERYLPKYEILFRSTRPREELIYVKDCLDGKADPSTIESRISDFIHSTAYYGAVPFAKACVGATILIMRALHAMRAGGTPVVRDYLRSAQFKTLNCAMTSPEHLSAAQAEQSQAESAKRFFYQEHPGLQPGSVGFAEEELSEVKIQEAIDRAYAWWFGAVGAFEDPYSLRGIPSPLGKTREEKEARRKYLQDLSTIKEMPRDQTVLDLGILHNWKDNVRLREECKRLFGRSPGFYNFLTIAENATPPEFDYWVHWYNKASDDVRRLSLKHGVAFEVVAAIVAVTSPGNLWISNLAVADYLLAGYRSKDPRGPGYRASAWPANARKVEKMLVASNTDQVRGPKVEAFFAQLVDPSASLDFATIDGHMINMWYGLDQPLKKAPGVTRTRNQEIQDDLSSVARLFHVHTQQLQAVLWYVWRYSSNKITIPARIMRLSQRLIESRLEEKASQVMSRKKYQLSQLRGLLQDVSGHERELVHLAINDLQRDIGE